MRALIGAGILLLFAGTEAFNQGSKLSMEDMLPLGVCAVVVFVILTVLSRK